jgi:hypothetical protein
MRVFLNKGLGLVLMVVPFAPVNLTIKPRCWTLFNSQSGAIVHSGQVGKRTVL